MKYCEYCGSEAQNHYSNCHSCGAPFSIKTVYSQEKPTKPDEKYDSFVCFNDTLVMEFMPILVTMAIIGYAVDKVGNLFRFRKQKVPGIEPVKYTYEKRRGYL